MVIKLANNLPICVINGKGCEPFQLSQVGLLGNRHWNGDLYVHVISWAEISGKCLWGNERSRTGLLEKLNFDVVATKALADSVGSSGKCQRCSLLSWGARCWAFLSSVWTFIGCKLSVEKEHYSAMGHYRQNRVAHYSVHYTKVMLRCVYLKSSFPFIICVT